MNRIDAMFEKVSYEQFEKDVLENMIDIFGHSINKDYIPTFYDNITLPRRATKDSAGYDFFFPFHYQINSSWVIYTYSHWN